MCAHRPCSRHVTERMECNFVIHPPPCMYHKATNEAACGQWAIEHNGQNDSSLIIFTTRDIAHWNYVTSQNIYQLNICQYMFLQLTFFVRPKHSSRKLISGTALWPQTSSATEIPDELDRMGNCNYRRPNMATGNSNSADNGHLNNVNMMFQ